MKRCALVTGGSRGIGAATALALAARGYDVAITYRSQRLAAEGVAAEVERLGRKAVVLQADLADPARAREVVREAADALGGLHALVNNAGYVQRMPWDEISLEDWNRMIGVTLTAAFITPHRLGSRGALCRGQGWAAWPHEIAGPGLGPTRDHRECGMPRLHCH